MRLCDKRIARGLLKYISTIFLLTMAFCLLLYVAGLGNETANRRIRSNLRYSVLQLKEEGNYPKVFSSKDQTYRLDNFTDMLILQQSLFMDTSANPKAIFLNPLLNKTYDNAEVSDQVLSLEEAIETGVSNGGYSYYWFGMRSIVRLLLCVMPYQNIRGVIAIGFFALFFAAANSVRGALKRWYGCAFFVAVCCMNLPIVASQLQYAPCFMVMFAAVICVIRLYQKENWMSLLFFVTGALTQYFDLYTCPLITLAFPLIVLTGLMQERSCKERWVLLLKCIAAWTCAYALFWLIRLLLVQTITGDPVFARAFRKFAMWTGVSADERYSEFTLGNTLRICFEAMWGPHNVCALGAVFTVFVLRIVAAGINRRFCRPMFDMLLYAMLPIGWIAIASEATGNHYWYQYRILSVMIFAVFAFLSSMINGKTERLINPEI